MQRMSEPQIVVLLVRTRTSPWPGVGTSNVRSSTVLLPGRIAPGICVGIRPMGPPGALLPGELPGMANLSARPPAYSHGWPPAMAGRGSTCDFSPPSSVSHPAH